MHYGNMQSAANCMAPILRGTANWPSQFWRRWCQDFLIGYQSPWQPAAFLLSTDRCDWTAVALGGETTLTPPATSPASSFGSCLHYPLSSSQFEFLRDPLETWTPSLQSLISKNHIPYSFIGIKSNYRVKTKSNLLLLLTIAWIRHLNKSI